MSDELHLRLCLHVLACSIYELRLLPDAFFYLFIFFLYEHFAESLREKDIQ